MTLYALKVAHLQLLEVETSNQIDNVFIIYYDN
jgi:hypothetical protein